MESRVREFFSFTLYFARRSNEATSFPRREKRGRAFRRETLVDDHCLGLEVGRHSGQSGAVLGRLDLEIGEGKKSGNRAQHHRPDEGRHRGNALRHDDDNAIAGGQTMVAEHLGLQACALPELGKSYSLALVFVDPENDEWTIAGAASSASIRLRNLVMLPVITLQSL